MRIFHHVSRMMKKIIICPQSIYSFRHVKMILIRVRDSVPRVHACSTCPYSRVKERSRLQDNTRKPNPWHINNPMPINRPRLPDNVLKPNWLINNPWHIKRLKTRVHTPIYTCIYSFWFILISPRSCIIQPKKDQSTILSQFRLYFK